ncbi:hypothetical protein [Sphingomonas fuzhouensis]|nr:hypothetical protein [Sphingomonas sp. SGZ-02]
MTAPTQEGFGTSLLRMLLAREIGGRVDISYAPTGMIFTAQSPLYTPRRP